MKQTIGIALGALALVASSARLATSQTMTGAPPGMTTTATLSDPEFVRAVAASNESEIAAARYVLRSSKNAQVRAFANQMIGDHATAAVSLQSAARTARVPVPLRERADRVAPGLQGVMEPQLDVAYMQQQISAHEKALAILSAESTGGKSPELRAFATAQVPVVKSHLDKAQNYVGALPSHPTMGASIEPISPGGIGGQPSGGGSLIPPSSPAPQNSNSPNPQPSVGVPGTLPSPGPSSTPHS